MQRLQTEVGSGSGPSLAGQGPTAGLSFPVCKTGTWGEWVRVFGQYPLVLRFLGERAVHEMLCLPTRAARDKQETDENNSAGSQAVSQVEEKTEPPSHRLLTL